MFAFKRLFKYVVVSFTIALLLITTATNAQAFPQESFRLTSYIDTLVVDSFGDNLPQTKTYAHLYSRDNAFKTAEMVAYKQTKFNNSFEIHMQNDRGLCFGPDVSARSQMRNGVRAVVKRDCSNTLNHFFETGQIRVNNTNSCLDTPGGNHKQGQYLQYWECNRSNAQKWAIDYSTPGSVKPRDGACYRKKNFGAISYPCDFDLPPGYNKITWTSGAWASVRFNDPNVGSSGKNENKPLNNTEQSVTFPPGVRKYTILPWNENATTRFFVSP
jgi:hypothetical protein